MMEKKKATIKSGREGTVYIFHILDFAICCIFLLSYRMPMTP